MSTVRLDELQKGQTAVVKALHLTGPNRRRLMDLGILPGTRIDIEMRSPLGDPVAYRIRGAVIALRKTQSREIEITLDIPSTEVAENVHS